MANSDVDVEHRRVYRRATTGRALSSCRAAGWSSAPSPAFGRNRRPAKHFENLAVTLATFVTLASIQLALGRLARAKAVTQQTTVGKCAMTKVGKSDGEGTLAGTRGNDKVAPKAGTRRHAASLPGLASKAVVRVLQRDGSSCR